MRWISILVLVVSSVFNANAQSQTTEKLHKQHGEALSFFFYKNTLRMINQKEDKEFDALVDDIEKMKFLLIDKSTSFGTGEYKKLVSNYKSEAFEEIMSSRYQGKSFDVFVKEKNGDTKAMLVLVNDSTRLFVLDIVGKIALDKITKLYSELNESADIEERIRDFTRKDD